MIFLCVCTVAGVLVFEHESIQVCLSRMSAPVSGRTEASGIVWVHRSRNELELELCAVPYFFVMLFLASNAHSWGPLCVPAHLCVSVHVCVHALG